MDKLMFIGLIFYILAMIISIYQFYISSIPVSMYRFDYTPFIFTCLVLGTISLGIEMRYGEEV